MGLVHTGSDVLSQQQFSSLSRLRVGFVGNHTSVLRNSTPTQLAMHSCYVKLVRLFSPEHGALGREDREGIGDDIDLATGLPIFSLYGETRKPTPEMLAGLDALVFELQDVGARFYTYASTMLLCLEACHEAGVQFIVLDRPNPITGTHVEGPLPDPDKLSFTCCHTIPIRHGLTLGELARLAGAERGIDDVLTVIPCEGWKRSMWWDETGLPWISPSPAMISLDTATVYPGTCLLEQAEISVGRGTDAPFLMVGEPLIGTGLWARVFRETSSHAGVVICDCAFTPTSSKFVGERCEGMCVQVIDREQFKPVRLGLAMAAAAWDILMDGAVTRGLNKLLVNDEIIDTIRATFNYQKVETLVDRDDIAWIERRSTFLLYS